MLIQTNAAYRFTRAGDSKVSINGLQRELHDGADVLVISAGPVHAQVEALDGAMFVVEVGELTDVAATDPWRFAGYVEPTEHGGIDANGAAIPPIGNGTDSPLRRRMQRDETAAASIAVATYDALKRTAHPALSGELQHTEGFAEGVRDYARFLRTGEMTSTLKNILT